MNRHWWEKIQIHCPYALEDCIAHFKQQYKTKWRAEIKHPQNLIDYFKNSWHIRIQVLLRKSENRYGVQVRARDLFIKRGYIWKNHRRAAFDGVEFAFYHLEERFFWDRVRGQLLRRVINREGKGIRRRG